jgi:hypothetical protein
MDSVDLGKIVRTAVRVKLSLWKKVGCVLKASYI